MGLRALLRDSRRHKDVRRPPFAFGREPHVLPRDVLFAGGRKVARLDVLRDVPDEPLQPRLARRRHNQPLHYTRPVHRPDHCHRQRHSRLLAAARLLDGCRGFRAPAHRPCARLAVGAADRTRCALSLRRRLELRLHFRAPALLAGRLEGNALHDDRRSCREAHEAADIRASGEPCGEGRVRCSVRRRTSFRRSRTQGCRITPRRA